MKPTPRSAGLLQEKMKDPKWKALWKKREPAFLREVIIGLSRDLTEADLLMEGYCKRIRELLAMKDLGRAGRRRRSHGESCAQLLEALRKGDDWMCPCGNILRKTTPMCFECETKRPKKPSAFLARRP